MPSPNNLRIIYQNLIDLDATTFLNATPVTNISNLKSDTKSVVWRSNSGTRASIILDFGAGNSRNIGGVILAFTNLSSSTATVKLIGYASGTSPTITGTALSTAAPSTPTWNTGDIACCPWNNLNLGSWNVIPSGASGYSYGGGTHARVWVPTTAPFTQAVRYLGIEINDPTNTASYIEVSRLIVGSYWSPTYNTGYGMSAGIKDLSEHVRTESGDLLTKRGPRNRTLTFDLQWMNSADRKEMTKIFLGNGMPRPLFVSLFPDSTGTDDDFQREGAHQIYGKMIQIPGVSYTNYEIYSTNIEIEEV